MMADYYKAISMLEEMKQYYSDDIKVILIKRLRH